MSFSIQVEQDLKTLAHRFDAEVNKKAFENFEMLKSQEPQKYQYLHDEDHRIYKYIWAPIICYVKGKREIRPMRYSLLPHFNKEYEKDSYQETQSILDIHLNELATSSYSQKPFMNLHACLPIKRFYEWVPKNGYKSMISFFPQTKELESREYMLVPCLYDNWFSADKKKIIQSFAIISGEATPKVAELGHNKAPLSLKEESLATWLSPEQSSKDSIKNILNDRNYSDFDHEWMM